MGGSGIQTRMQRVAMGGFGYGLVRRYWPDIPRIPGIGHSGTVALAVYFLKPTSGWMQDVGIAAAAIAGASFGQSGSVSGFEDPEDDVLNG